MKNEKIKNNYRINEQIRSREVRLVGDDVESTVMPTHKAIQLESKRVWIWLRFRQTLSRLCVD